MDLHGARRNSPKSDPSGRAGGRQRTAGRRRQFSHKIVATNKASYISLRGPWAVETLVRERLMDKIAATVGITPVELRNRNLIRLADQPT